MKLSDVEKQALSDAIDKMNEGLDAFIGLYNESEEDKQLIVYDDDVTEIIQKAINRYGEDKIAKKINSIIREVLSLLASDEVDEGV
ncbi:hypothetical protein EJF36_16765 [Bacillus sp. HMF5848]|uniref:hypothetical protein n=1 Tax=Bacillus sp. HMF5848 TaxID=2495421 RepID=UPI000F76C283|nr:hypothetical protein [Bacillus sp. HMF5848]RSK28384.1 hypothetical protein EJF36_16765 [Bacillus sp. HMF5848]